MPRRRTREHFQVEHVLLFYTYSYKIHSQQRRSKVKKQAKAGRPPTVSDEDRKVPHMITIDRRTADILRDLAGGNLSNGVRMAASIVGKFKTNQEPDSK